MKSKDGYTLVTTALQETWPAIHKKTIFLGKWCLIYGEKEKWSNYNFILPEYHWNNRKLLYKDYEKLNKIYEVFLGILSKRLNNMNSTNYDKEFWRIIIGHWLGYFIQIIYDRWTTINEVFNNYEIDNIYVLDKQLKDLIPLNYADFKEKYATDEWNEQIYKDIIFYKKFNVNVNKLDSFSEEDSKRIANKPTINELLKTFITKNFNINADMNVFFVETNMGWWEDFILQFKLGQIPRISSFPNLNLNKNNLDYENRKIPLKINFDFKNSSVEIDFLNYICRAIPRYIPYLYFEGFKKNLKFLEGNKYISALKPKFIFTSTGHFENESFKLWTALQQRSNAKLVIAQHGGFYGIGKYSFNEEHEKKISNFYLTYGWHEQNNHKIIKNCVIRKSPFKNIKPKKDGICILVTASLRRYSNFISSLPIAHESWETYHQYQEKFVGCLNSSVKLKLLVRCMVPDWGNNHVKRWSDNKNVSYIDDGKQNIKNLIYKSRIFVSTYNATSFLESLQANFPTLIYWDKNIWETKKESLKYLEMLEEAGILHYSYKSAAEKLNEIWDDIEIWWNDPKLQILKDKFCDRYSNSIKSRTYNFFKKKMDSASGLF